jgi:copper resistance protein C
MAISLSVAGPVSAHVALVSSDPADGAVLDAPPGRIVLEFTEDLRDGSSFDIVGPAGTVTGAGTPDPDNPRRLVADTPALAPGSPPEEYEIRWTAIGDDRHVERGIVRFAIAEPTPSPTPAATPTPTPAVTGASTASPEFSPTSPPTEPPAASPTPSPAPVSPAGDTDVVVPIVAGLAIVGALGVFLVRRTRAG